MQTADILWSETCICFVLAETQAYNMVSTAKSNVFELKYRMAFYSCWRQKVANVVVVASPLSK